MIMNEFEALTNSANGPIVFTYYAESELPRSTGQYFSTLNDIRYQTDI